MDIGKITGILNTWLEKVEDQIQVDGLYLFGSSIIKNGFLFDDNTSDIDLVIVMPDELKNAVQRTEWLDILYKLKLELELEFAQLFKRTNNYAPLCSLIPVTSTELYYDFHKSGVENFFRDNEFLEVKLNSRKSLISKKPEEESINNITKNVIEFCQGIRNKFLATSFIETTHALNWQSLTDPVPKELVRTVALAAYVAGDMLNVEEKTDIGVGLSNLIAYVHLRRHEDDRYMKLDNWLTRRLLRKGEQISLDKSDYVFISEIIFDMALSQVPIKKNTLVTDDEIKTTNTDEPKAIETLFLINNSGLINGLDEDVIKDILNVGVNLAWNTKPFFEIEFEEKTTLTEAIKDNPKDGVSIDRLRKLKLVHELLEKGYEYIVYYQNHFFINSENMSSDVLKALQAYTILCFANIFSFKAYKGIGGGILEAYIFDYGKLKERHPCVSINGVIKFGLPDHHLQQFLNSNSLILQKDPHPDIMTLSSVHPPISDMPTEWLAQFFVPLLVKKLVDAEINPQSENQEIQEFVFEFTTLKFWSFGIN